MDQSRGPPLDAMGVSIKKRRSQTSRRPRPEADQSPISVAPGSDDMSKVSSDENIGEGNSGGKMFNLSQCVSRSLPVGGSNGIVSNGSRDGGRSENRPKKVKLKVGGVTRTLQTKSSSNGESGSGSSMKANHSSDNARPRARLVIPQVVKIAALVIAIHQIFILLYIYFCFYIGVNLVPEWLYCLCTYDGKFVIFIFKTLLKSNYFIK